MTATTTSPWVQRAIDRTLPASDRTGLIRLHAGEPSLYRPSSRGDALRVIRATRRSMGATRWDR